MKRARTDDGKEQKIFLEDLVPDTLQLIVQRCDASSRVMLGMSSRAMLALVLPFGKVTACELMVQAMEVEYYVFEKLYYDLKWSYKSVLPEAILESLRRGSTKFEHFFLWHVNGEKVILYETDIDEYDSSEVKTTLTYFSMCRAAGQSKSIKVVKLFTGQRSSAPFTEVLKGIAIDDGVLLLAYVINIPMADSYFLTGNKTRDMFRRLVRHGAIHCLEYLCTVEAGDIGSLIVESRFRKCVIYWDTPSAARILDWLTDSMERDHYSIRLNWMKNIWSSGNIEAMKWARTYDLITDDIIEHYTIFPSNAPDSLFADWFLYAWPIVSTSVIYITPFFGRFAAMRTHLAFASSWVITMWDLLLDVRTVPKLHELRTAFYGFLIIVLSTRYYNHSKLVDHIAISWINAAPKNVMDTVLEQVVANYK